MQLTTIEDRDGLSRLFKKMHDRIGAIAHCDYLCRYATEVCIVVPFLPIA